MSYSKDTPRLIQNALNITSQIVESDTEVSVIDLNLLESLNTNQSLNYIKLEETLNTLEDNADKYKTHKYSQELDKIESQIILLDKVVKEIDQWCKNLDAKLNKKATK